MATDHQRRNLVIGIAVGSVMLSAGGWFAIDGNNKPLTIAAALVELDQLLAAYANNNASVNGEWDLAQMLNHCAQSVEYSLSGFPEHKSDLFKHSVGALAFTAFAAKGRMTHGLSEPIPGAPTLAAGGSVAAAAQRFKASLAQFHSFSGMLMPHFAYGYLSKAQYELAHVMHFYNHLTQVVHHG
ncbi:DUF1569 domain-containing protein [Shewanella maritima]|uniref:DUF1569 domain-containing protein n=1 Tax=Shewanella maritima TaxID=2520507 RepID=A0A411PH08_9GAMM|nr:DUF1569 domain-containing protein [Shewanella maritima]QBF82886.1 DUF1569 domain-containing protein [Shewanella maritima]